MTLKKSTALESVLGRLDDLDSVNLTILVQRLARERHFLETVLEVIREGILVIDRLGTIEYANPAAVNLLGLPQKDIGRINLWRSVPNLVRTLHLTREGEILETSGISREVEIDYPEARLVRFYIIPMVLAEESGSAEHDHPLRYAVILSDITEERASTQRRIESEKVQSIVDLAAGVAHELGNPINSLTIHLQLMQRAAGKLEDDAATRKIRRSIDVCTAEVERLDGIITHFLEAVRPRPPDFSDVNLIELLEETLEFLRPELEGASISADIAWEEDVPVVHADRNQIKQVFFNIFKNARESMPKGGAIKVRVKTDDEFVYLLIGDTGEGISEGDMTKIFQPYFSTKRTGTGLGMMICQRIMRNHGGQIGIDSRKDVGTLVTLQFPQKHRRVRLLESGDTNAEGTDAGEPEADPSKQG